jgi:hypothetical protein
MAIEETLTDNRLFVTYDLGGWSKGMNRDIYGRFVEVAPGKAAQSHINATSKPLKSVLIANR